MPSSKLRRSPAKTLSAMGLRRSSFICSSLISAPAKNRRQDAGATRLGTRNGYCRAPKQQEQETNITVHRKKRSIHPAEVIRRYQRVLVGKQRGHHDDPHPGGPRQVETPRQPCEQSDHHDMHGAGNGERSSNAKALRDGKKSRRLV